MKAVTAIAVALVMVAAVAVLPAPARSQTYLNSVSITEIMPRPSAVDPVSGQWIELQNLTGTTVNLQGLVLMTTSLGGFHTISPSAELLLEPGAILVLGARPEPEMNGGANVGYSYGNDAQLNPESDVVLLWREKQLVDYASYGSTGAQVEQGYSVSREPSSADDVPNWCLARRTFGAGDHGTPGLMNNWCDNDLDSFAEDEGDCDDTDSAVRPGGTEFCNGFDDDCDGITDEDVVILQGICPSIGVCAGIVPVCAGVDGWACPAVPGWEPDGETLCDGLDNDCDGDTDEKLRFNGLVLGSGCTAPGECGPGTVVCSPVTARPTCSSMPDGTAPGSSIEQCDGLDNDCDGFTDEGFQVGEPCSAGLGICAREGVVKCDGHTASVCTAVPGRPGPEYCGDRLDNDCDGFTDEGFLVGEPCVTGTGDCRSVGRYVCSGDLLDVACPAVEGQPGVEICGDLLDNDCDGDTDETGCERPTAGCSAGDDAQSSWILLIALVLSILSAIRHARKPRNAGHNRRNDFS